jgi:thiamine biosynthesis lipoprotein
MGYGGRDQGCRRILAIPMRKLFVSFLPLLGLSVPRASFASPSAIQWHETAYDHVLGTSLELKIEALDSVSAASAEKAALAEIERLAAILSSYDATSELSRWMKTRNVPVSVSAELFEVLALFDSWRIRTGGALDASTEAVARLWRKAEQQQTEPSDAELRQVVAAMQQTHWRLDFAARTATHLTDTPLRLNSLTKCYIIDRACNAALATGKVASVSVNIGGDLVVRGRSTDFVGIVDPKASAENDRPLAQLAVQDRAVATSGGYRRGVTIGGQWFSHLIDPHTGRTVDHVRSATVVGRSATEAGALATALCIMPPETGAALAKTMPGIEYLVVTADGSKLTSPGWNSLEMPSAHAPAASIHGATPAASGGSASPSATAAVEVLINLEIAPVTSGRAKRPFVAVWIEDPDHSPVRTIGLWFKGARWLRDLRSWSRAEKAREAAEGSRDPKSIAGATRGPGKYTLRWDGTDDSGKVVPPGRYTLFVEVAREHGTHQVVSSEIDTAGEIKRIDLPSNPELSSVSIDVRGKVGPR